MLVFKIEDKFLEQDQVILYKISFLNGNCMLDLFI